MNSLLTTAFLSQSLWLPKQLLEPIRLNMRFLLDCRAHFTDEEVRAGRGKVSCSKAIQQRGPKWLVNQDPPLHSWPPVGGSIEVNWRLWRWEYEWDNECVCVCAHACFWYRLSASLAHLLKFHLNNGAQTPASVSPVCFPKSRDRSK